MMKNLGTHRCTGTGAELMQPSKCIVRSWYLTLRRLSAAAS